MLLRAMNYPCTIQYRPGKSIPFAETLFLSPISTYTAQEMHINNVTLHPMRNEGLECIRGATANDNTLATLGQSIVTGCPDDRNKVAPILLPYYNYRDELSVENDIIVRCERIIIPSSLRRSMREKMYTGHLGFNACLRRTRELLY